MGISDEELIARLRSDHPDYLTSAAADRIEALLAAKEAAEARLAEWQGSQSYRYIGRDGKPVLARDLEDRAEAAESALAAMTRERDAERETVARLTAALRFYSCEDGCNDCPASERDRIGCGWTARAALTQKELTDWRSSSTKTEDGYNG